MTTDYGPEWVDLDDDEDEVTYKIVRFYRDENHHDNRRVVKTGLTLAEAQEWCNDEATHGFDGDGSVEWFDGYMEE